MDTDQEPYKAFPLSWPLQEQRTPAAMRKDAQFRSARRDATGNRLCAGSKTMTDAVEFLYAELERLDAVNVVVSTNIKPRLDGMPRANEPKPVDPGAAVYFVLAKRPMVLACDRWLRVEDNLYAIAKHIEAIRAQERWGVGSRAQAFRGYLLLTGAVAPRHWRDVLGANGAHVDAEWVTARYRTLAADLHPDKGGTADQMAELNRAKDEALAAVGSES